MHSALNVAVSFIAILSVGISIQTGKKPIIKTSTPIARVTTPSIQKSTVPAPKTSAEKGSFPYYYDPRIHNFGNIGAKGQFHAEISPVVTRLIDRVAYKGEDIRKNIMLPYVGKKTVLDLACGVGASTMPGSVGVDTSPAMLQVASRYSPRSRFVFGNAETYGKNKEFDVVTCMFAFHEMPIQAHIAVVKNAIRVAKSEVIIVDICPSYTPSKAMLSGEPYALAYLASISGTLRSFGFKSTEHVANRVTVWKLKL